MKLFVLAALIAVSYGLKCHVCMESSINDPAINSLIDSADPARGHCLAADVSRTCGEGYDTCFETQYRYKWGEKTGNMTSRGCGKKDKSKVNYDCAALKEILKDMTKYSSDGCTDTYCEEDDCNSSTTLILSAALLTAVLYRFL